MVAINNTTSQRTAGSGQVIRPVSTSIVLVIVACAVLVSGCSQSAPEAPPTGDAAADGVALSDNPESTSSPPGAVSANSPPTDSSGGAITPSTTASPSTTAGGDGGEQPGGGATGTSGVPRSRDAIFREQLSLPRLYMTHPSHRRITASTGRGVFVDPESGELAWPALACHRPECPGRGRSGQPYLFISPDSTLYAAADGTIAADVSRSASLSHHDGQCPMCKTQRRPGAETPQQRQQYIDWVRPHVLPAAAQRMVELERQRQHRIQVQRQQAGAN